MLASSKEGGFFENYKEPGINFQATIFIKCLDKKIYFVMQHNITPRIYAIHKITIALKFMAYTN